ncbi:FadR/GntR family transcriptional regulator [Dyella telluris]|uniref:FadR family transcriptional regulator n=1 Tax=Dyella telluris TaxID=2763498 RepID=A0A7G8Q381_9GAMM|nr:FCD domain-containing protein [Dyella telluris]QNK01239.1 FadR family transcriptional regulator [Dyella telluris]
MTKRSTPPSPARPRHLPVATTSSRSLYGHVVHELGQRIIGGDIKPGELLPREELLAEELEVSRTALREGMKVLVAKGLVESRPKVGTRVRDTRAWHQLDADVLAWRCALMPTEDFVRKLADMREVIEPAAAATAAKYRTYEQLRQIEEAFAAMEAAANLDAWADADLAFHEAVLNATNNELMVSLFTVIESAMATFFVLSARTAKNFKDALPLHGEVLDAIRRSDPDAARGAMLAMVEESRANMRRGSAERG